MTRAAYYHTLFCVKKDVGTLANMLERLSGLVVSLMLGTVGKGGSNVVDEQLSGVVERDAV